MASVIWLGLFIVVLGAVFYRRPAPLAGTTAVGLFLLLYTVASSASALWLILLWLLFGAVATVLNADELRRQQLIARLLPWFRKVLPSISPTEREALEAGSVWWDGELFSGQPDWQRLLDLPAPALSAEEQAFLDGPVETLCEMLSDWDITQDKDLPARAWKFIREEGFFGMIIPPEYGGKGFSALAHSEIVMKISSRSGAAGVSVMVPNSLGPGELLLQYGTEAQKTHYLPRLAGGQEIPCFALTGPHAGSDAAALPDVGIVCTGEHEGEQVLGLRLTWDKRYITLAPVATLLGLAFRARDPDHLLGNEEDLGPTLALIPADHPGVEIGNRHYPLSSAFQNGPTRGQDVFIPLDWIIGGRERIGQGWRMLMGALAAGRGISLPALSVGAAKVCSQTSGAYARIRRQFHVPIASFEGVQTHLAAIAGETYRMDGARLLTLIGLDQGEHPAVISGIVKQQLTDGMRRVVDHAMDVHGGKGICDGPRNYLAQIYRDVPISITVEGANTLTRSLIIFGQGAVRCHPYLLREMLALQQADDRQAVLEFDQALMAHLGYGLRNATATLLHGLTGARLAPAPTEGPERRSYQQLGRLSAAFCVLADLALLTVGGNLKRKERLSGHLADVLSQLYLASGTLKRFADTDRPAEDLALLRWALDDSLARIGRSLEAACRELPQRWLGVALRWLIFPLGNRLAPPAGITEERAVQTILTPTPTRERLIAGIYLTQQTDDARGRLEHGLREVLAAEPIEAKLQRALRRRLAEHELAEVAEQGLREGIINREEAEQLRRTQAAIDEVIAVDDFPPRRRQRKAKSAEPNGAPEAPAAAQATPKKKATKTAGGARRRKSTTPPTSTESDD